MDTEPARFGWCQVGDHRACRAEFSDRGRPRRYRSRLQLVVELQDLAAERRREVERLSECLATIHGWAEQIADHFDEQRPHTPACQGEAGCPLCGILAASENP